MIIPIVMINNISANYSYDNNNNNNIIIAN